MRTHIVKHGDTLWKIAKHYGVNFEALKKINKQLTNQDMMLPGQEIQIPLSGIIELVEDDNHQKVTMKPSSSITEHELGSLKGHMKEMPIHPIGGMYQKEHIIHQIPIHKEQPLSHPIPVKQKEVPLQQPVPNKQKEAPLQQPVPNKQKEAPLQQPVPNKQKEVPLPQSVSIKQKEVPMPHTMPKEVPIQHHKQKTLPKEKKVPIYKPQPIQHVKKEQPLHFEPHFNFSHSAKQQVPKQVPNQIKNDIHPEIDIHNNYYLTNMQMIEQEHKPKLTPEPKSIPIPKEPPKKEVHYEVQNHEMFILPEQEVQIPIEQNECLPVSYEEFYIQPDCESFYGFGIEPEMMMQNQIYGGYPQYMNQTVYGLDNYEYMMRNPHYQSPFGGGTNPFLYGPWMHIYYPWQHMGYHHLHHHHHPHGHQAHYEVQKADIPVMGKQCNCGCQSKGQNQTQHPYYQQEVVPVMGNSYGYDPRTIGQQTQMYHQDLW